MYSNIFNKKSNTISSAAYIIMGASFLSSILALFRDRLLANSFGAGNELDIYYAAFRIPDFIAMVMIMGAISAAIIPIFSSKVSKNKEEAFKFLANLINVFLFSLIVVSIILTIFVPQLLSLIVPGFSGEKKEATILLTRIMFLSPILLGISNIISGVLRVFKRFLITSIAPILYNVGIITGILVFVPRFGISGLAWGVVFGGFLHLLVQIPILFKLGYIPRFSLKIDKSVIKTIKLTIPRAIGLAAGQINLIVITAIGSTLATGSIAIFSLANNLQSIPITLVAVSLSTAAFPFLSLHFARQEKKKMIDEFSRTFIKILFFIIPISALVFLLRAQITRVILGTGQFGWVDTQLTAASLGVFSFAIFAYGLSMLISKTFYAISNTVIPAFITLVTVAFNIVLSYTFIWLLSFTNFFSLALFQFLDISKVGENSVIGLPLALAISGIFQLVLLLVFLYKEIGDFGFKKIIHAFREILVATIFLGAAIYFSAYLMAGLVDMTTFIGIFLQGLVSGIAGLIVYLLMIRILK